MKLRFPILPLALAISGNALASDTPLDATRYVYDFDQTNTPATTTDFETNPELYEQAVPIMFFRDWDADGYPEFAIIEYRVYNWQTGAYLYSTDKQVLRTPNVSGCTDKATAADELQIENVWNGRRTNGRRLTLALNFATYCDGDEISKTGVYSANLAFTSKASWKYMGPDNFFLVAAGGVDPDGDGTNEFMGVQMLYEAAGDQEKAWTVALDWADGTKLNEKAYPFFVF